MKLYFSGASPYVRKVQVTAIETGLDAKIEHVPITVGPTKPDPSYGAENPLYKVPTLVTDGGEVLYDSPVICEYLDAQGSGPALFPAPGKARWTALRRQALADGILDAAERPGPLACSLGDRHSAWHLRPLSIATHRPAAEAGRCERRSRPRAQHTSPRRRIRD